MTDRPFDELVSTVSEQAVIVAREQVELARREMTAKVRQAGTGAAMVGGAGVLAALASGTGTAALVLLLSRRRGPSAAALSVAGAYTGAAALLAREGLARLREAGPLVPEQAVHTAKRNLGSTKRGTKAARNPGQRSSAQSRSAPAPKRRPSTTSKQGSTSSSKRTQPRRTSGK